MELKTDCYFMEHTPFEKLFGHLLTHSSRVMAFSLSVAFCGSACYWYAVFLCYTYKSNRQTNIFRFSAKIIRFLFVSSIKITTFAYIKVITVTT